MILRDGKFYEGDKVIPLEFGNKEQIKLMNQANELIRLFRTDGVEVSVNVITKVEASASFKCVCGQTVWKDNEVDDEDDIEPLQGYTKCQRCQKEYDISQNDDGELIAKYKHAKNL